MRKAHEEAERKAREEVERKAQEKIESREPEETESRADEKTKRKMRKEAAERKARVEAARKAREEAKSKAQDKDKPGVSEKAGPKANEAIIRKAKSGLAQQSSADPVLSEDNWVEIPGGTFLMGSPDFEKGRGVDERRHQARVHSCYMLKTAVTFTMYDIFCQLTGREKAEDEGWGRASRPVINVSYWDAVDYCSWLSERIGSLVRLPSEAEWEYACRAGTDSPFWTGDNINAGQANYDANYVYGKGLKGVYRKMTLPVAFFQPNPWGLYEMSGNVWEWCASKYNEKYDGLELCDASRDGLGDDAPRVLRGGSWVSGPGNIRSAARGSANPDAYDNKAGFRILVQDSV